MLQVGSNDEIFFLGVDATSIIIGAIIGAAAAITSIAIIATILIIVRFRQEQTSVESGHGSEQDVVSIISNKKIN